MSTEQEPSGVFSGYVVYKDGNTTLWCRNNGSRLYTTRVEAAQATKDRIDELAKGLQKEANEQLQRAISNPEPSNFIVVRDTLVPGDMHPEEK